MEKFKISKASESGTVELFNTAGLNTQCDTHYSIQQTIQTVFSAMELLCASALWVAGQTPVWGLASRAVPDTEPAPSALAFMGNTEDWKPSEGKC